MNAPRRYTDEEFARILRRATELAPTLGGATSEGASTDGLTLAEMQAAAVQVGLDPALIARAAYLEVTAPPPSLLERLVGGPLRHAQSIRVPVPMEEARAERLLSAVRIGASPFSSSAPGHSSALGMTWDSSGEGDVLHVTARADGTGTELSVMIDRRGTFVLTALVASFAGFLVSLFGMSALWPEIPALGLATMVVGGTGIFAAARRFWSATTSRSRHRVGAILETMRNAMS